MAISRRDVLLRGSAIGVGIIAANVPGLVAFAQPLPPLRRSLHGLALNDPILQAWRDGVRLLKARPASDPVSWAILLPSTAATPASTCARTETGISYRGTVPISLCMSGRCGSSPASATSRCHIGTGPWIGRCRRLSSIQLSLEILIRYSRPSAMPRHGFAPRQHRGAGDHQSDSP